MQAIVMILAISRISTVFRMPFASGTHGIGVHKRGGSLWWQGWRKKGVWKRSESGKQGAASRERQAGIRRHYVLCTQCSRQKGERTFTACEVECGIVLTVQRCGIAPAIPRDKKMLQPMKLAQRIPLRFANVWRIKPSRAL